MGHCVEQFAVIEMTSSSSCGNL